MVGTPGRIIDMLDRKNLILKDLQTIVLDESDQMLNMGFQEDVEKIYQFIQQQNKGMRWFYNFNYKIFNIKVQH